MVLTLLSKIIDYKCEGLFLDSLFHLVAYFSKNYRGRKQKGGFQGLEGGKNGKLLFNGCGLCFIR